MHHHDHNNFLSLHRLVSIFIGIVMVFIIVIIVWQFQSITGNNSTVTLDPIQGVVTTKCDYGKLIRTTQYTTAVMGDCK